MGTTQSAMMLISLLVFLFYILFIHALLFFSFSFAYFVFGLLSLPSSLKQLLRLLILNNLSEVYADIV